MAKKTPSKVRTGSHSRGGAKKYQDVKRQLVHTPPRKGVNYPDSPWKIHEDKQIRQEIAEEAARNKRLSTPTGRFQSGSAAKSGADSMNAARTNTGKRLSNDQTYQSAVVRKRRAASKARSEARRAAANAVRYADVSVTNPPSF
mgnify:CR=1 FL=1|tara:strand:+ start:1179 stop:1610 length:432 start_codon:yes stop_codon:yes gene_type:complete